MTPDRPEQPMTVTVDQAGAWLATVDRSYRPFSPARVARFAGLMNERTWSPPPSDPIRIDVTGKLRGGRMRLMALVAHGQPVTMWVDVSPPVTPDQLVPARYVDVNPVTGQADGIIDGRTPVDAIRFDGENVDAIRAWVMDRPGHITSVTTTEDGRLKLNSAGMARESWCFPGDWISREAISYIVLPHSLFARMFRKSQP